MKKIILCGSISAADEILRVRNQLIEHGFEVEIPWSVQRYEENGCKHTPVSERNEEKKQHDLIRRYYHLIKENDALLVVNVEKNGMPGYIGGNTFLEMGFAHVLDKKIYVLNPLPEVSYLSELQAMDPTIIKGDLTRVEIS